MLKLFGIPVIVTPAAVSRVERRVRGGYMNRWLIREVVLQPTAFVYQDPLTHGPAVITMHPLLAQRMAREGML